MRTGTPGIFEIVKLFIFASIALALWQGFNGDLGAILLAIWGYIQQGAAAVTDVWNSLMASKA